VCWGERSVLVFFLFCLPCPHSLLFPPVLEASSFIRHNAVTSGFKAVNPFLRTAQRTRVPLPCSGKGPGLLPANLFGFCLIPHLSHISCLPRGHLGPLRKLLRALR